MKIRKERKTNGIQRTLAALLAALMLLSTVSPALTPVYAAEEEAVTEEVVTEAPAEETVAEEAPAIESAPEVVEETVEATNEAIQEEKQAYEETVVAESMEAASAEVEEVVVAETEEEEIIVASAQAKDALAKSDLSSLRLLIGTKNQDVFENETAIIASYNDTYLLQFETIEDAEKAFLRYYDYVDFVTPDAAVSIASNNLIEDETDPQEPVVVTDNVYTENDNPFTVLEETNEAVQTKKSVIVLVDTGAPAALQDPNSPDYDKYAGNVIEALSLIDNNVYDENGHGTRMVDFILEQNPEAEIISVKALDKKGVGDVSAVVAAIYYAIEKQASIIDLSLSAYASEENSALVTAIQDAVKAQIEVVGAAGNQGFNAMYYIPGSIDEALVVGACDAEGERVINSNFGATVDYNVVAKTTSEAAAKMSGFLSLYGVEGIEDVLNQDMIFETRYVAEEVVETEEEEEEQAEGFDGVVAQDTLTYPSSGTASQLGVMTETQAGSDAGWKANLESKETWAKLAKDIRTGTGTINITLGTKNLAAYAPITIPSGKHVTINGNGKTIYKESGADLSSYFIVEEGASLNLNNINFDGKTVTTETTKTVDVTPASGVSVDSRFKITGTEDGLYIGDKVIAYTGSFRVASRGVNDESRVVAIRSGDGEHLPNTTDFINASNHVGWSFMLRRAQQNVTGDSTKCYFLKAPSGEGTVDVTKDISRTEARKWASYFWTMKEKDGIYYLVSNADNTMALYNDNGNLKVAKLGSGTATESNPRYSEYVINDTNPSTTGQHSGAFITSAGTVNLSGVTLRNANITTAASAPIMVTGGEFNLRKTTITNNTATGAGAILQTGGTVTLEADKNKITNNVATANEGAGAIQVNGANAKLYIKGTTPDSAGTYDPSIEEGNTIISGNTGNASVFLKDGKIFQSGGVIKGHTVPASGDAATNSAPVKVSGGTYTLTNGAIRENKNSSQVAGSAYISNGKFDMQGGVLGAPVQNNANTGTKAGAIYVSGSNATFEQSGGNILNNQSTLADYSAGAIYAGTGSKVELKGGNIKNNTAPIKGLGNDANTDLSADAYFKNTTDDNMLGTDTLRPTVGGVMVDGATLTMSGSTASISGNKGHAGAVYIINGGTFDMNGGKIGESDAPNKGRNAGAVMVANGTFNMLSGSIQYNETLQKGTVTVLASGKMNMDVGTGLTPPEIHDNKTTNKGGAIYIDSDQVILKRGNIYGNKAGYMGGAIYVVGDSPNNTRILELGTSGHKAYIYDNTAGTLDDFDIRWGDGRGGGVWFCAWSTVLYDQRHVVIDENKLGDRKHSAHGGIDVFKTAGAGLIAEWTETKLDENNKAVDIPDEQFQNWRENDSANGDRFRVKRTQDGYYGQAKLYNKNTYAKDIDAYNGLLIHDNQAPLGGGLGLNGIITFRELPVYRKISWANLKLYKAWNATDDNPTDKKVDVKVEFIDKDEKVVSTQEFSLKKGESVDGSGGVGDDGLPAGVTIGDSKIIGETTGHHQGWYASVPLPSFIEEAKSKAELDSIKTPYDDIRGGGSFTVSNGADGKVGTVNLYSSPQTAGYKIRVTEVVKQKNGTAWETIGAENYTLTMSDITKSTVTKIEKEDVGKNVTIQYHSFNLTTSLTNKDGRTGQVEITKKNEAGEEVKKAGFTLYKYDSATNAYVQYQREGQQNPIVNNTGATFLFSGLEAGDYKITETTTPPGHTGFSGEVKFSIDGDGRVAPGETGVANVGVDGDGYLTIGGNRVYMSAVGDGGVMTIGSGNIPLKITKQDNSKPASLTDGETYFVTGEVNGKVYRLQGVSYFGKDGRDETRARLFDHINEYGGNYPPLGNFKDFIWTYTASNQTLKTTRWGQYHMYQTGTKVRLTTDTSNFKTGSLGSGVTYTANTYNNGGKFEFSVTNTRKFYDVTLQKKSGTEKLEDVSFSVFNMDGTAATTPNTAQTDNQGKITFENLMPGTYYMTEETPDGYKDVDGKIVFTIAENGDVSVKGVIDQIAMDNDKQLTVNGQKLYAQPDASGNIPDNNVTITTKQTNFPLKVVKFVNQNTPAGTTAENLSENGVYMVNIGSDKRLYVVDINNANAPEGSKPRSLGTDNASTGVRWKYVNEDGVLALRSEWDGNNRYLYLNSDGALALSRNISDAYNTSIAKASTEADVDIEIQNEKKKYDILLKKVDTTTAAAPVEGAVFAIYARDGATYGDALQTKTSGADGVIRFEDLTMGNYAFKEISAPKGYVSKLNGTYITFDIDANGNVTNLMSNDYVAAGSDGIHIVVQNEKIVGEIKIHKTDSKTNADLEGFVFTVKSAADNAVAGSGTTDANGMTTIGNLVPGEYYIEETPTSDYWSISGTIPFVINPDGTAQMLTSYGTVFVMDDASLMINGKQLFLKNGVVSFTDGKALYLQKSNTTFDTRNNASQFVNNPEENGIYLIKVDDNNYFGYDQNGGFGVISGGANIAGNQINKARWVYEKLKDGQYVLRSENKVSGNYKYLVVKDNAAKVVTAGENNVNLLKAYDNAHVSLASGNTFQIEVKNDKVVGDVSIRKVDSGNNALEGAGFRLYKMDGTNKKYAIFNGNKFSEWTTNKDAAGVERTTTTAADAKLAFEGLEPGTYYIEESTVPAGHRGYYAPIRIEIVNNSGTTSASAKLSAMNVALAEDGQLIIDGQKIYVDELDNVNTKNGTPLYLKKQSDLDGENVLTLEKNVKYAITDGTRYMQNRKWVAASNEHDNTKVGMTSGNKQRVINGEEDFLFSLVDLGNGTALYSACTTNGRNSAGYLYVDDTADLRYVRASETASVSSLSTTGQYAVSSSESGVALDVKNEKVKAEVKVIKVNDDGSKKLANATFTLYKKGTGTTYTAEATATTVAETGLAVFSDLEPGDYYIEETTAPTGYRKNAGKMYFTVNADGTVSNDATQTASDITFNNTLENGYAYTVKNNEIIVTVEKVDEGKNTLPDATFSISGGKTETKTTGADGLATFASLTAGKAYTIKEDKAPAGYKKYDGDITFTIDADGEITLTSKVANVGVGDGNQLTIGGKPMYINGANKVTTVADGNTKLIVWNATEANSVVTKGALATEIVAGNIYMLQKQGVEAYLSNENGSNPAISLNTTAGEHNWLKVGWQASELNGTLVFENIKGDGHSFLYLDDEEAALTKSGTTLIGTDVVVVTDDGKNIRIQLVNTQDLEIEKYVNKKVHEDIEVDDIFEYTIMAYAPVGSTQIIIEDTLEADLEFVDLEGKYGNEITYSKVVRNDLNGLNGEDTNHKGFSWTTNNNHVGDGILTPSSADRGTVTGNNTATGHTLNAVNELTTAGSITTNATGQVTTNSGIAGSSIVFSKDGTRDKITLTLNTGARTSAQWYRLSFFVHIKEARRQAIMQALESGNTSAISTWENVTNDAPLIKTETPHAGIRNQASYKVGFEGGRVLTDETNVVTVKPETDTKVQPEAKKIAKDKNGNDLPKNGYEFELRPHAVSLANGTMAVSDMPMPAGAANGVAKATSDANGVAKFGEIEFTKAGTYTYRLTEVDKSAANPNMSYDKAVYELTYTVSYNQATGKLEASKSLKKETFTWSAMTGSNFADGRRYLFEDVHDRGGASTVRHWALGEDSTELTWNWTLNHETLGVRDQIQWVAVNTSGDNFALKNVYTGKWIKFVRPGNQAAYMDSTSNESERTTFKLQSAGAGAGNYLIRLTNAPEEVLMAPDNGNGVKASLYKYSDYVNEKCVQVKVYESTSTWSDVTEASFTNVGMPGPWIELKKTNNDFTTPLGGASFTLYEVTNPGAANEVRKQVGNVNTDELGTGTFTWNDLSTSKTYCIVETAAPRGFTPIEGPIYFTVTGDYGAQGKVHAVNGLALPASVKIEDGNIRLIAKNVPLDFDFEFKKVNSKDHSLAVANAKFTLTPMKKSATSTDTVSAYEKNTADTANTKTSGKTPSTGRFDFMNLTHEGYYVLEESETPAGYIKRDTPWFVLAEIKAGDTAGTWKTEYKVWQGERATSVEGLDTYFTIDGVNYKLGAEITRETLGEGSSTESFIPIENTEVYVMPSTGGMGTYLHTILGTMFMALGAAIVYTKGLKKRISQAMIVRD